MLIEDAFKQYGLDPALIPEKEVKLVTRIELLRAFPDRRDLSRWLESDYNDYLLCYTVESEFSRPAGFSLRNLYMDKDKKAHFFLEKEEGKGPYFHNFSSALPLVWETGRIVVVEGPKDARILWQYGLPAVACLTSSPKKAHLEVISRYADYVIWVQDNDSDTQRMEKVRKSVSVNCEKLNIRFHRAKMLAKDPAEQHLKDTKFLHNFANFVLSSY